MTVATSSGPSQGWYPDPHDPQGLRWWNGTSWTEFTATLPPQQPSTIPGPAAAAAFVATTTEPFVLEPAAEPIAEPAIEIEPEPAAEIVPEPAAELTAEPIGEVVSEPALTTEPAASGGPTSQAAVPEALPSPATTEPASEAATAAPPEDPTPEWTALIVAAKPAAAAEIDPWLAFVEAIEPPVEPVEVVTEIAESPSAIRIAALDALIADVAGAAIAPDPVPEPTADLSATPLDFESTAEPAAFEPAADLESEPTAELVVVEAEVDPVAEPAVFEPAAEAEPEPTAEIELAVAAPTPELDVFEPVVDSDVLEAIVGVEPEAVEFRAEEFLPQFIAEPTEAREPFSFRARAVPVEAAKVYESPLATIASPVLPKPVASELDEAPVAEDIVEPDAEPEPTQEVEAVAVAPVPHPEPAKAPRRRPGRKTAAGTAAVAVAAAGAAGATNLIGTDGSTASTQPPASLPAAAATTTKAPALDTECLKLWNTTDSQGAAQLRVTLGQFSGALAQIGRVAPLPGTLMQPDSCGLMVYDPGTDTSAVFVAGVEDQIGYLDVTAYPRAAKQYGFPKQKSQANVKVLTDGTLRAS